MIVYYLQGMKLIEKWSEIIKWQRANLSAPLADLSTPIAERQLEQIEEWLREEVPLEFRELYSFANGQKDNGD